MGLPRSAFDSWLVALGVVVVILVIAPPQVSADRGPYRKKVELTATAGDLFVRHKHDWSQVPTGSTVVDVFAPDNDYSYVEFYRQSGKRLVDRQPAPPLTHMWLAPDGSYLVGLSHVKRSNLYQLVVYRGSGHLVHKEHIASQEACFDEAELARFLKLFPKAREPFGEWSRTLGDTTYVDAFRPGARSRMGREAAYALAPYRCPGRYPVSMAESIGNHRRWYHRREPAVRIERRGAKLVAVSLRDLDGTRFAIPVNDDWPQAAPDRSAPSPSAVPSNLPPAPRQNGSAVPRAPSRPTGKTPWWLVGLLAVVVVGGLLVWRSRSPVRVC
ncbi:MAG: hypothetical protein JRI68_18075 [Deltaproteobacteria bacterium]|nr:hypothetical protein [Deltaproteobacteria bacterium]